MKGTLAYPQRIRSLLTRVLILLPVVLAACAPAGSPPVQETATVLAPPAEQQATATVLSTPTVAVELPSTGGTAQAVTPSVTVKDQAIEGGMVTIAEVVSDGPGWLVIHAQSNDAPGPVIGYAPVENGENTDVMVEIDESQATDTLYAMLHVDAGQVGVYEFPGADGPATVNGQAVSPPFTVSNAGSAAGGTDEAATPSVSVEDQAIEAGTVTIADVVSDGPGWLVIHAQNGDAPGPVIGYAPVQDGDNADVKVEIDESKATETLYAMLHIDAGQVGVYEFPGEDGPAMVGGQVVTPPFKVLAAGEAASTPAASKSISLKNNQFSPAELTIPAGTTVVWTNNDSSVPHTVTADDGSFDSGNMGNGDTFQFTFDEPGTYPYYCAYHGGPGGAGMAGTIIVQ